MIFCVEDDAAIREIETYTLQATGYEAKGLEDGGALWNALETEALPELILLDVMLPGEDGVSLLRRLKDSARTKDIPVIMATARGMEYDKIQSLDLGADDYLVKPFGMMEMVARVRAVLRRCGTERNRKVLRSGELLLDPEKREVRIGEEKISLTFKEFELLQLFLEYPGTVFSRDRLFRDVWGEDYIGESRTVDMHIRTLRQKLGRIGDEIETVRNVGYRWKGEE